MKLVENKGIEKKVFLLGYKKNIYDYMRAGNIPSAWISGFFIGVGLVVMVPHYLEGFDSYFTVTSALGWFSGAILMYYGNQEPYVTYLKKLGW